MKYQAIIFDMDGTIINSEPVWHKTTQKLIQEYGNETDKEREQEFLKETTGLSLAGVCILLKTVYNLSISPEELAHKFNEYAGDFLTEVKLIDGFETFHANVHARELSTAIATNSNNDDITAINKLIPLSNFFGKHIYTISHVQNPKPDPALYLHAANKLGIAPTACIAIEDSGVGVEAAKRAGMYCIGINTAQQPHKLAQADQIIDHYDEIDLEKILY